MNKNYWVISDTHFNHQKSLIWRERFKSLDEMNDLMVDRWNAVVAPNDYVYHLGDVFFGPKAEFQKIWSRLNGKKRLIVGNHDDIRFLSGKNDAGQYYFKKVSMWKQMEVGGKKLLMTHTPLHPFSLTHEREGSFNVFGHIHNAPSPDGRYQCVCVEKTDYSPVNLEEVASIA